MLLDQGLFSSKISKSVPSPSRGRAPPVPIQNVPKYISTMHLSIYTMFYISLQVNFISHGGGETPFNTHSHSTLREPLYDNTYTEFEIRKATAHR